MELRQSVEWGKYLESLGWQTEVIDGCALRVKKLGFLGCIIKIQRPDLLPLEKIEAFAKKSRALFVKIEPRDDPQAKSLITNHYSLDSWPLTPARTVFLDLTETGDGLLKSFSKDARRSIKKSENPTLNYRVVELAERQDDSIKQFYSIWKQTGARGNFWVPPFSEYAKELSAFSGRGFFILSHLENNHLVSGCLIFMCDGVAYYHHAASTLEGQTLHAPYGQLWRAILESKNRSCTKLDLEGIFDPRFKEMFKAWLNFSAFKLKWGGRVHEYPGALTKGFNPLLRLIFRLIN